MSGSDSAQPERDAVAYYPNNIGQSSPASSTTYEFLVEGSDLQGRVPGLIVNALLKRGARIISQTCYVSEKSEEFTLSLTCDLGEADGTPDELVIQLRKINHITHAETVSLKDQMFNAHLFPLVFMHTNRVLAINASLIFDLQEKLTSGEKSSLTEAGTDYGKKVVNGIKQRLEAKAAGRESAADNDLIIENVKGYMKAAGWGKFSWESQEGSERVVIQDPPTPSKGGNAAGNLFLHGLMAGMTEALQGKAFGVMEDHYDSLNRRLTATLVEQSRIMSEVSHDDTLSKNEKAVVLGEIEKIIGSVEEEGAGEPKLTEEMELEQQTLKKVIEVPVTDFGRVHVTIKRRASNAEPGSMKPSGEQGPSAGFASNITEKSSQGNLAPRSLDIISNVPKEKLPSETEEDKNGKKTTEKDVQVGTPKTLSDLQNRNDVLIALMKRKKILHYDEVEGSSEMPDDSDTSFENAWK